MFSPDGTRLVFASNRFQGKPGETNVFVARWVDTPKVRGGGTNGTDGAGMAAAAARFLADVEWLADDARQGRGIGTRGLEEAARWLADRFRELGLEPAGDGGTYRQSFEVPVAVDVGPATEVSLDGRPVAGADFRPASFSSSGTVEGEVVAAGYGITAPELGTQGMDDYKDVDAQGKIAVVRRFVPAGAPFDQPGAERRYSELRYKAWNAREHGARALIVVDLPAAPGKDGEIPAEAPLPSLQGVPEGDAGIPVVVLSRAVGAALLAGGRSPHRASLRIDLKRRSEPAANVVGVLRAGSPDRLPGAALVGAHYDHLGLGGAGSLAPDSRAPHNGADDNASGTAALLEVARRLAAQRSQLRRDVWFVAFSGEESGVLGSTAFTRQPPAGLAMKDLVAMLNMDMVGRLREDRLTIFGTESAEGLEGLVLPACERARLSCVVNGDGYGPSDHSPFYAAGVPVLHFFTGTHGDYHKPSDDAGTINAPGGARVAGLVGDLAAELAGRPERLAYKSAPAPAPQGDVRSYGASLGTIPDYAGDGRPGVLLAGVRPGSAAEKAGMQRGDLLVELGGKPIRDIHDFMFVLQSAKPGDKTQAVVLRGEARLAVEVVYGSSSRLR
jgi:hypothetical protein